MIEEYDDSAKPIWEEIQEIVDWLPPSAWENVPDDFASRFDMELEARVAEERQKRITELEARLAEAETMKNRRHIVVFISGPFRAPNAWEIEQNIRQAETLALEAWRAGFTAICPHTNTRFFQGAAPDEIWLEGDLEMLHRCDGVLVTPNWELSRGAKQEVREAEKHCIPVFHSIEELEAYRWPPAWDASVVNQLNAKEKEPIE